MKKDVWLSINSTQQFEGCDPEHIDLMTRARFYRRNGKFYISYDESELTGLEGTRTTVRLDGKEVTMIRTGTCPSQMVFAEAERHVGLYHIGVGAPMTVATRTSRVDNAVDEDGGKLIIDYIVEVDDSIAGEHHFEMLVSTEPAEC